MPMSFPSKRWAAGVAALAVAGAALLFWLRPELFRAREPRVIVVGLDAADWQLLEGYCADGTMPNLARLVREGRSGILKTFQPPLSPLIWTTMMTGVSPLQHRILDFTRFNPKTGVREPITSDERLEKAVWEMANDHGREVAVLGMWATHPAEPVRGLMISERLFAILKNEQTPPGVVHPPDEQPRVLAERAKLEGEVGLGALQAYLPWLTKEEFEYLEGGGDPYLHPVTMLRRILIETRLYHRLALDWTRRRKPALTVVYFEGTDSIGHVFAAFAPPQQLGIEPKDFQRYQSVPRDYFKEVDAMLGDYQALAEETGASLLIVSDHGFLWHEGRPRSSGIAQATAALWHREEGLYVLWGRGVQADGTKGEGRVGQVAATILALLKLPRAAGTDEPALGGVAEVLPAQNYGPRSDRALAVADSGPAGDAVERLKALGYVGSNEPAVRPDGAGSGTRTAGSFTNEGSILMEEGKNTAAKAAFEQALRLDPKSAAAKYALASILEKEGRSGEADGLLLAALADGLGEGPLRVEEIAAAALRQGDVPRSLRLLDGAVATLPENPRLRLMRGRIRIQTRDCGGALEDFDAARRVTPESAWAHALAGSALMCLGRPAEARRAFERSLELDPSQTRLRELLSRDR